MLPDSASVGSSRTSSSLLGKNAKPMQAMETTILPYVYSLLTEYPVVISTISIIIELLQCLALVLNSTNPGNVVMNTIFEYTLLPLWDGTLMGNFVNYNWFLVGYFIYIPLIGIVLVMSVLSVLYNNWVVRYITRVFVRHVISLLLSVLLIPTFITLLSGVMCQHTDLVPGYVSSTPFGNNVDYTFTTHILFFNSVSCSASLPSALHIVSIIMVVVWGLMSYALTVTMLPVDRDGKSLRRHFNPVLDNYLFVYKVGMSVCFVLCMAYGKQILYPALHCVLSYTGVFIICFYLPFYERWINSLYASALGVIGSAGMAMAIANSVNGLWFVEQGYYYIIWGVVAVCSGIIGFALSLVRYNHCTTRLFQHCMSNKLVPFTQNPFVTAALQNNLELLPYPHHLPRTDESFSPYFSVSTAILEEYLREEDCREAEEQNKTADLERVNPYDKQREGDEAGKQYNDNSKQKRNSNSGNNNNKSIPQVTLSNRRNLAPRQLASEMQFVSLLKPTPSASDLIENNYNNNNNDLSAQLSGEYDVFGNAAYHDQEMNLAKLHDIDQRERLAKESTRRQVVSATLESAHVASDAEVSIRFIHDWTTLTQSAPTPYMLYFASRILNRFMLKYNRNGMLTLTYVSFLCDYAASYARLMLGLDLIRNGAAEFDMNLTERFLFYYFSVHIRDTLGLRNATYQAIHNKVSAVHESVLLQSTFVWKNLSESRDRRMLYCFAEQLSSRRYSCYGLYLDALDRINGDERILRNLGNFMGDIYNFDNTNKLCDGAAEVIAHMQLSRLQSTLNENFDVDAAAEAIEEACHNTSNKNYNVHKDKSNREYNDMSNTHTSNTNNNSTTNMYADANYGNNTADTENNNNNTHEDDNNNNNLEDSNELNTLDNSSEQSSFHMSGTLGRNSSMGSGSSSAMSEAQSSQSRMRTAKRMSARMIAAIRESISEHYHNVVTNLRWNVLKLSNFLCVVVLLILIFVYLALLLQEFVQWQRTITLLNDFGLVRTLSKILNQYIQRTSTILPTNAAIGLIGDNQTYLQSNITFINSIINALEGTHRDILYGRPSLRYQIVRDIITDKVNHVRFYNSNDDFVFLPVSFVTQIEVVIALGRRISEFMASVPSIDEFASSQDVTMLQEMTFYELEATFEDVQRSFQEKLAFESLQFVVIVGMYLVIFFCVMCVIGYTILWNFHRAASVIMEELELFYIIPSDAIKRVVSETHRRLETFLYLNEKRNAILNELDDSESIRRLSGFNDRSSYSSGMIGGGNNGSYTIHNNNITNSSMMIRNSSTLMLSMMNGPSLLSNASGGMITTRGRNQNDEIAPSSRLLSHIIEHGGLEVIQQEATGQMNESSIITNTNMEIRSANAPSRSTPESQRTYEEQQHHHVPPSSPSAAATTTTTETRIKNPLQSSTTSSMHCLTRNDMLTFSAITDGNNSNNKNDLNKGINVKETIGTVAQEQYKQQQQQQQQQQEQQQRRALSLSQYKSHGSRWRKLHFLNVFSCRIDADEVAQRKLQRQKDKKLNKSKWKKKKRQQQKNQHNNRSNSTKNTEGKNNKNDKAIVPSSEKRKFIRHDRHYSNAKDNNVHSEEEEYEDYWESSEEMSDEDELYSDDSELYHTNTKYGTGAQDGMHSTNVSGTNNNTSSNNDTGVMITNKLKLGNSDMFGADSSEQTHKWLSLAFLLLTLVFIVIATGFVTKVSIDNTRSKSVIDREEEQMECTVGFLNSSYSLLFRLTQSIATQGLSDYLLARDALLAENKKFGECVFLSNPSEFMEASNMLQKHGLIALTLLAANQIDKFKVENYIHLMHAGNNNDNDNSNQETQKVAQKHFHELTNGVASANTAASLEFFMLQNYSWSPLPHTKQYNEMFEPYVTTQQLDEWLPYSTSAHDLALNATDRVKLAWETFFGPFNNALVRRMFDAGFAYLHANVERSNDEILGNQELRFRLKVMGTVFLLLAMLSAVMMLIFGIRRWFLSVAVVIFELVVLASVLTSFYAIYTSNAYRVQLSEYIVQRELTMNAYWNFINMHHSLMSYPFTHTDQDLEMILSRFEMPILQTSEMGYISQYLEGVEASSSLEQYRLAVNAQNNFIHYLWPGVVTTVYAQNGSSVFASRASLANMTWDMSLDEWASTYSEIYPNDTYYTNFQHDVLENTLDGMTNLSRNALTSHLVYDVTVDAANAQVNAMNNLDSLFVSQKEKYDTTRLILMYANLMLVIVAVIIVLCVIIYFGYITLATLTTNPTVVMLHEIAFTNEIHYVVIVCVFIVVFFVVASMVGLFAFLNWPSTVTNTIEALSAQWILATIMSLVSTLHPYQTCLLYEFIRQLLSTQFNKFSEVYRKTYLLQDQSKWLYQPSKPWVNKDDNNNGVDDYSNSDNDDSNSNSFNNANNNKNTYGTNNGIFNSEFYQNASSFYDHEQEYENDEYNLLLIQKNSMDMFGSMSGAQPHIVKDISSSSHSAALLSAVCVDPAVAGGNQELPAVQIFAVYDLIMSLTHITDYVIMQASDDNNPISEFMADANSRIGSIYYSSISFNVNQKDWIVKQTLTYTIICSVFLGLAALFVCILYFMFLRKTERRLQQFSVGVKLQLLGLPESVLNAVPEVKEFYTRDASSSRNDQMKRKLQQSEKLLQNILPPSISRRLKNGERVIADSHQSVTAAFAALVGFDEYASQFDPQQIVLFLNGIVVGFDHIVDLLDLEKVKTIGDIYFFCGGLIKTTERDHAIRCVECALYFFKALEVHNSRYGTPNIKLKIGLNTDSAVAGVIGNKKVAYDI